jgi:hypothetical protein
MIFYWDGDVMIHYAAICWERGTGNAGTSPAELESHSHSPNRFNCFTFEETVETVKRKTFVIITGLKPCVNETDYL